MDGQGIPTWQVVQGWALVSVAVGGAWWYYTSQTPKMRRKAGRTQSVATSEQPAPGRSTARDGGKGKGKDAYASSGREEMSDTAKSSGTGNQGKKKEKQKVKQVVATSSVNTIKTHQPPLNDPHDDDNDQEFAALLSNARKGTQLQASTNAAARQKTVRQSAATERSPILSGAASNGGADADDDLSPVASPALAGSRDVSDMLEAPAPGPSIIRLTASKDSPLGEKKKSHSPAPQEPAETKKQRQRRQKKEQERVQREADEQERRRLMEQQRRTAREARGEPARNGVPAAPAPSSNAWQQQSKQRQQAPKAATAGSEAPLLDTFDPMTSSGTTSGSWESGLPSEEEQMQRLNEIEGENSWSMVTNKKTKKDRKGANGTMNGESSGTTSPAEPASFSSSLAVQKPGTKINGSAKTSKSNTASGFGILSEADKEWTARGDAADSAWTA